MDVEERERETERISQTFQVAYRDLFSPNLAFLFPRVVLYFRPCWYPDLVPAAQPACRNNAGLSRRHARICRELQRGGKACGSAATLQEDVLQCEALPQPRAEKLWLQLSFPSENVTSNLS